MNKKTLLLEIGLEEMPARFVTNAMNELTTRTESWLKDLRMNFESVQGYSTPRRLAVMVTELEDKQPDIEQEAKGPSENVAVKDGAWTKAAEGFARGQGVSVDDLYFQELKGENYVYAKKYIQGENVLSLLPQLKEVLLQIPFPKNMKWADNDLRYVRPIKWITALLDEDVIPFEITEVYSGRSTQGHRFLGNKVELDRAEDYVETLMGQHVIVNPLERKQAIQSQIEDIADSEGWVIPVNEDLLEEVNNLVEYPTALFGSFDESYLQVPDEVLITSMREHQRYFPVMDKENNLLPFFITVRNGDHRHLENVRKGNEKVLRARLADAEFFFNEDKKETLEARLPKLDAIVYHEELGSVGDKVKRVETITRFLALQTKAAPETVETALRAAKLSKADLVTHMVGEFTELEGNMGEYYALNDGETTAVAQAIREHYMPKQSGDLPPASEAGSLVGASEKLDTLLTSFGIGNIPTGSQDPHGLRRQTAGILQIYLAAGWKFDLFAFMEEVLSIIEKEGILKRTVKEIMSDLHEFFELRYKNLLKDTGVRYDVAESVMNAGVSYPHVVMNKSSFLMNQLEDPVFKKEVEAFSRVTNIAQKADEHTVIAPEQFQQQEENNLYEATVSAQEEILEAEQSGNVASAYETLKKLVPVIHEYFDNIMVMAEEEEIKQNRLAQMQRTSTLIRSFADFQKIVFHSQN
ncbi:glycine--tRNA ligase subunit beta [Alkalicoccus daliensis]|uniref:Glycine--tRNA ligase beta subunit n=1 Tax=Alkalicoccus daliensis TaxID=745820 RepID=A0A1H0BC75_9BACI|nr:glycine--tRNA ligase subunit beta [Alkalicoccus daliensis]SDN43235.1 glycyl-tRNA synthetase beta chain [Alkalicoccus daliensis]